MAQLRPDKALGTFYASHELLAQGKVLARDYDMSFSKLIKKLLEDAIERWAVPQIQKRPSPDERVQEQKDLT